jgi:hypothetical protein
MYSDECTKEKHQHILTWKKEVWEAYTNLEERGLGGIQPSVSWGNHHINRSNKPNTSRGANLYQYHQIYFVSLI